MLLLLLLFLLRRDRGRLLLASVGRGRTAADLEMNGDIGKINISLVRAHFSRMQMRYPKIDQPIISFLPFLSKYSGPATAAAFGAAGRTSLPIFPRTFERRFLVSDNRIIIHSLPPGHGSGGRRPTTVPPTTERRGACFFPSPSPSASLPAKPRLRWIDPLPKLRELLFSLPPTSSSSSSSSCFSPSLLPPLIES